MSQMVYRALDGHVEVLKDAEPVWWGDVLDLVALKAMSLPGTDDGIVLMDWSHLPPGIEAWHPCPNLVRIHPDGSAVWTAELPPASARSPTRGWRGEMEG